MSGDIEELHRCGKSTGTRHRLGCFVALSRGWNQGQRHVCGGIYVGEATGQWGYRRQAFHGLGGVVLAWDGRLDGGFYRFHQHTAAIAFVAGGTVEFRSFVHAY